MGIAKIHWQYWASWQFPTRRPEHRKSVPAVQDFLGLIAEEPKSRSRAHDVFRQSNYKDMLGELLWHIVIPYSAAISACEKGMQRPQALELFERMFSDSVPRNILMFNAAISSVEKGAQ